MDSGAYTLVFLGAPLHVRKAVSFQYSHLQGLLLDLRLALELVDATLDCCQPRTEKSRVKGWDRLGGSFSFLSFQRFPTARSWEVTLQSSICSALWLLFFVKTTN